VIPDAADPAVIGDDATAVAVDQSEHELFGGLVDKGLLPGFEGYRSLVFHSRAVLWQQARPVLGK
jgi:hypothetical protein